MRPFSASLTPQATMDDPQKPDPNEKDPNGVFPSIWWDDLSYQTKVYTRQLRDVGGLFSRWTRVFSDSLQDVYGQIRPGHLVGIIPTRDSQLGAIRLASILSTRILPEYAGKRAVKGQFGLDGLSCGRHLRHYVGGALATDPIISTDTLGEALNFAAKFRVRLETAADHVERAAEAAHLCRLEPFLNSRVGTIQTSDNGGTGLPPDVRARARVAMRMASDPLYLIASTPPLLGLEGAYEYVASLRRFADSSPKPGPPRSEHAFSGDQPYRSPTRNATAGPEPDLVPPHQRAAAILFTAETLFPATLRLCDDLIVMANGTVVYCGPTSAVEAFYSHHGMPRPQNVPLAHWIPLAIARDSQFVFRSSCYERRCAMALTSRRLWVCAGRRMPTHEMVRAARSDIQLEGWEKMGHLHALCQHIGVPLHMIEPIYCKLCGQMTPCDCIDDSSPGAQKMKFKLPKRDFKEPAREVLDTPTSEIGCYSLACRDYPGLECLQTEASPPTPRLPTLPLETVFEPPRVTTSPPHLASAVVPYPTLLPWKSVKHTPYNYSRKFFRQYEYLFQRHVRATIRNVNSVGVGKSVFIIFYITSLWFLQSQLVYTANNRSGLINFVLLNNTDSSMGFGVAQATNYRLLLWSESDSGMYSPAAYIFATTMVDLFWLFFWFYCQLLVYYFPVRLYYGAQAFFTQAALVSAAIVTAYSLGGFLGSCFDRRHRVTMLTNTITFTIYIFLFTGGLAIDEPNVRGLGDWVMGTNFIRYALSQGVSAENRYRSVYYCVPGIPCPWQSGPEYISINKILDIGIWMSLLYIALAGAVFYFIYIFVCWTKRWKWGY